MKFNHLRPMIWSAQFDETILFYTDVLGFTLGERNDHWGWAAIHRDNVEIMLAKPNAHARFDGPVFTGSFYINLDDVEAFWSEISGKVRVCYAPETFEWGMREFAIYDNNGYLLQFGQDLA